MLCGIGEFVSCALQQDAICTEEGRRILRYGKQMTDAAFALNPRHGDSGVCMLAKRIVVLV